MVLNTVLFKHTANFPHLQDGNLGPDPIPTEVSEKTSINANGPWNRALFKYFNASKIYFSTDNFPLVITPKLTSEFESTLNRVSFIFNFLQTIANYYFSTFMNQLTSEIQFKQP